MSDFTPNSGFSLGNLFETTIGAVKDILIAKYSKKYERVEPQRQTAQPQATGGGINIYSLLLPVSIILVVILLIRK